MIWAAVSVGIADIPARQQASSVIGVDLSDKMLQKAREMTNDPLISYIKMPIEDIDFSDAQFDVVISSLAFHYAMTSSIPLKRLGSVEDIAYSAIFPASKEARYITGQTIIVDCGQIIPESLEAMG